MFLKAAGKFIFTGFFNKKMQKENYKNIDFTNCTMYDLHEMFPEFQAIILSPIKELSDEELRIMGLYCYTSEYGLIGLIEILEEKFSETINNISS